MNHFCDVQLRALGQFSLSRRCRAQQRLFDSRSLGCTTCGDQDFKNQSSRISSNLIFRGQSDSTSVSLSVFACRQYGHRGRATRCWSSRKQSEHLCQAAFCPHSVFRPSRVCSHILAAHLPTVAGIDISAYDSQRRMAHLDWVDAIVVAHAYNCCFTIVCCCGFSVPPHLCHLPIRH